MAEKLDNPFKIEDLITTVNDCIDNKQETLISGVNIKTINGLSLLGSGNIIIEGESGDIPENYVTIDTDQIISGEKIFTQNLIVHNSSPYNEIANSDITKSTLPNETKELGILFEDNAISDAISARLGDVIYSVDSTGNSKTELKAYKFDNSNDSAKLSVTYPLVGNPYTYAPNPANDSNDNNIATTSWVRTLLGDVDLTNYVKLNTAQTITGNKTFSGTTTITGPLQVTLNNSNDVRILNQYTSYTKGTAPSTAQYSGIVINDNAGTEMATFYSRVNTNNINSAIMLVKNPGTGVGEGDQKIAIHYPADGTAYTEAPTPDIFDDSTKIATTAFVKAQGYAIDSGLVHLTGTETITGDKTFSGTTAVTGQLQVKSNDNDVRVLNQYANYTKGTTPSAVQYSGIVIKDNTGTEIANIYGRVNTNNTNSVLLAVKDPGTGNNVNRIAIHYPADGTAYTEAPTPDTSDNSTKIATTAFVKAQGYASSSAIPTLTSQLTNDSGFLTEHQSLANYVTLDGAQTITATKTFTADQALSKANPVLKLKNTSITRNTVPSSDIANFVIDGQDNAGRHTWAIYHTYDSTKQNQVQLLCYKGTTTTNNYAGIGIGYDSSGNVFTNAPTPAVSSNTTHIATTAYINNKFKVVSTLPASPDADTYYFIPE